MMMNLCLGRRILVSLEMPDSIQKQLFNYFVPFSFPEKSSTFPFEYFFENFKCLASSFYANLF